MCMLSLLLVFPVTESSDPTSDIMYLVLGIASYQRLIGRYIVPWPSFQKGLATKTTRYSGRAIFHEQDPDSASVLTTVLNLDTANFLF